jgi:hypothetical protein
LPSLQRPRWCRTCSASTRTRAGSTRYFLSTRPKWRYEGDRRCGVVRPRTAFGSPGSGLGARADGRREAADRHRHVEEIEGESLSRRRARARARPMAAGVQMLRHWEILTLGGHTHCRRIRRWGAERCGHGWLSRGQRGANQHATAFRAGYGASLLAQVNAVFHGRDEVGTPMPSPITRADLQVCTPDYA